MLRTDQTAERLLQPKAREQVIVTFAEAGAARLVQDAGLGPRHLVEHHQPQ